MHNWKSQRDASDLNHSRFGLHADAEPRKAAQSNEGAGKMLEGGPIDTLDHPDVFYAFCVWYLMMYMKVCKGLLVADETPEDHQDIKEMRRRVLSNFSELSSLDILKEK